MLLVFGGTTEGRKAAEVLEEAGSPYFYSTKTGEQDISLHHGTVISGAMNGEAMLAFFREHGIRLVVDAAHPFATQLHETIARVCSDLQVPIIRYERIYPPRDPSITWIDDYSDIAPLLSPHGGTLLATTGVQSIGKLKRLEREGMKVIYRILNRESSIQLAHQQGATDDQLCFYEDNILPDADAILLKESGLSGGFTEKIEAAKKKGIQIIVIKRPRLFNFSTFQLFNLTTVNGPHGLRRAVEKVLPEFFPLYSGLTTGTCATAAAVAAAIRLFKDEMPSEVPVLLPDGETISVPVGYGSGYAYCIKEAGDDPDVTNGIEVRVAPLSSPQEGENLTSIPLGLKNIEVYAGKGIGRFTLPGFDFPPGEPAINKAPREMIRRNLEQLSIIHCPLSIVLSIPNGEDIARRTFNPRLGIEGGISIIGVSGIVKPFSEEAFINSIRKCMEVAKASGTERVVINSGFKSEQYLKALYPDLPAQAFVQYGNYIGETLRIASELSIPNVTLGVMLGKAVKLAQGHLDTHSKKVTMDINFIQEMLQEANIQQSMVNSQLTLARELWERIPKELIEGFCRVVISHCAEYCESLLPDGHLTILLIDDDGTIHSL
ncbi:MAG: cobalt-precorrin-5B (C(1))-methyltransferase [Bacteroidaceae bacterium]|nr:cobalt-precorrin-5B (C(1))-methyltransferase [Bacteroidaceae bacterium]